MGGIGMVRELAIIGTVVALGSGSLRADYVVSLVDSNGSNVLDVSAGDTVNVELRLFSDAEDQHDAHVIWLVIDSVGLEYVDYQWGSAAFEKGGQNDFSQPSASQLATGPIAITQDTVLNPFVPSDIDFKLDALTVSADSFFSVGTLATLTLKVPDGFAAGPVTISVGSADFRSAGTSVSGVPGSPLTLNVASDSGTAPGPAGGDGGNGQDGSVPPVDTDGDGVADETDTDDDNDGVADSDDAFPLDPAETTDSDLDGTGDNADAFPLDDSETMDTDGDGVGNNADSDDDNDGVVDVSDAFPLDSSETTDSDGDGVGDNADVGGANANTGPRVGGGVCGLGMLGSLLLTLLGLTTVRVHTTGNCLRR